MTYRLFLCLVTTMLCVTECLAGIVTLEPSADTTIYQSNGANSNGGGGVLFTGNNSAGSPRRGLLWFDIAGNIPSGAMIDSVSLTLHVASFGGSGGEEASIRAL